MKASILISIFLSVFACSAFSQDTASIHYFNNDKISTSIIYEGDNGKVTAYNIAGHLIFLQEFNLNEETVDYSLSYYENGAVENIKITTIKTDLDVKEVNDVWFDAEGRDITGLRTTEINREIEIESQTYEFEGGVIFRPRKDESE